VEVQYLVKDILKIVNYKIYLLFDDLDAPLTSPLQLLTHKKAHPKRHLVCAVISSVLFVGTGKSRLMRKKLFREFCIFYQLFSK
jgi:hypothetical protein